jgi:hypothetical protein
MEDSPTMSSMFYSFIVGSHDFIYTYRTPYIDDVVYSIQVPYSTQVPDEEQDDITLVDEEEEPWQEVEVEEGEDEDEDEDV